MTGVQTCALPISSGIFSTSRNNKEVTDTIRENQEKKKNHIKWGEGEGEEVSGSAGDTLGRLARGAIPVGKRGNEPRGCLQPEHAGREQVQRPRGRNVSVCVRTSGAPVGEGE